MAQKVTPKILAGFMELLPSEQLVFDEMKALIEKTYQSFGFVSLDTPVLELSDVLLAKAGGETEKQIYRFHKGDNDLCMRFDLTVPLARYVAQRQNDLTFPFKRYQISKVYRGERPQKGRFREFYQADIDIIGSEKLSVIYDAEMPAVMYHVFQKLGLERFCIKMNNRKLMNGFYESLNLTEQSPEISRIIDKMDKIGVENVKACLKDLNLSDALIDKIISFTEINGKSESVIEKISSFDIHNELFEMGLNELKVVAQAMHDLGVPETHFEIDLKITRGLDYYTGTVYETFVDGYQNWGSICSGGRYENLAGYYTDRKLPGVGMSIGLTRFFDLLRDQKMINPIKSTAANILILPMDEEATPYALRLAHLLRQNEMSVQTYAAEGKFKNKMVYANKVGVPFVIVLGEDEVKNQMVALKNMQTGVQELVTYDKIVEVLKQQFAIQEKGKQKLITQA